MPDKLVTREAQEEIINVLRQYRTAVSLLSQPLRLDATVGPNSPGGQTTAILPDGTPVARYKYIHEIQAKVDELLCRFDRENG